MHLHLRRLPQRILPPVNISNDKQKKSSQQSLKRLNPDIVAQYHHTTCYIRKIRHSVPGCGGRIDIASVHVSVSVPVKTLLSI